MTSDHKQRTSQTTKLLQTVLAMTLALAAFAPRASAQPQTPPAATQPTVLHTFFLTNVSTSIEGTEIVTAVRNMLTPSAKAYFVSKQNALIVDSTPDQIQLVEKLLADLDRPRRTYRLTYTIAESEGSKRVGVQHFAMVVVSGEKTIMKQGSKVPVVTGTFTPGSVGTQKQFTYIDVGLNFDAMLDESVNGVRLRTKVEQSSIAEVKAVTDVEDPIVRQTVLEGSSILTPGKPLALGSLDIPGTTRHLDVEVMMEIVR